MKADDIELRMTCGACPEQYDAYHEGEMVGYLRLRHGYFRVECGGSPVYTAHPEGDGCFEWDERERYLTEAKRAIASHYGGDCHTTASDAEYLRDLSDRIMHIPVMYGLDQGDCDRLRIIARSLG